MATLPQTPEVPTDDRDPMTGISMDNPEGGGELNDDEMFLPLDIRLDIEKLRKLGHMMLDWKLANGRAQHVANDIGSALANGDCAIELARLALGDESADPNAN